MYLVTSEDEDGMWWDEPVGFNVEDDARRYIENCAPLPEGYSYVMYRCTEISLHTEVTSNDPSGVQGEGTSFAPSPRSKP